jgi:hypothetical protein
MTGDTWTKGGDYSVEIWFRLTKDADRYPKSKNWEQLLAEPLAEAEDCFRITSIPFFVRDVCRGDVVRARTVTNPEISEKPIFEFDRIVEKGGHNTYRLLLKRKNPKDPEFTETELISKGLAIEREHNDFFAVDVPPTVDQQVIDQYLLTESESGRWEMQDGCLQTIRTT